MLPRAAQHTLPSPLNPPAPQDRRHKQFGIFVVDKEEDKKKSAARSRLRGGRNATPLPHADLPRAPRPLRNEDFLGDVFMRKLREKKKYTFVFKRKLFLRDDDDASEDPMFSRLVYLQAVDEVISGNVPLRSEDLVCSLTAQAIAVDLGRHFPKNAAKLVEEEFMEYIPKPWRAKHEVMEWAMKILQQRKPALSLGDEDTLQDAFVETLKENPLYGSCFFQVKKAECDRNVADLPNNMVRLVAPQPRSRRVDGLRASDALPVRVPRAVLTPPFPHTHAQIAMFNSDGLHFVAVDGREILRSFGYADIYRWGGSSRQFSLVIWDQDTEDTFEMVRPPPFPTAYDAPPPLVPQQIAHPIPLLFPPRTPQTLYTGQAADMAALILDYINAIMDAQ